MKTNSSSEPTSRIITRSKTIPNKETPIRNKPSTLRNVERVIATQNNKNTPIYPKDVKYKKTDITKCQSTHVTCSTQTNNGSFQDVNTQTDTSSSNLLINIELLGRNWLSDNTINRHIDLLNCILLSGSDCTILNPLIVHAVKSVADYSHFLDPHNINKKKLLIMPINDCQEMVHTEGSHWSVLFYDTVKLKFFHYDSNGNYNMPHAYVVARKLSAYLHGYINEPVIININGPQQSNNYDCGVFMLTVIELIALQIARGIDLEFGFLRGLAISETELIIKRSVLAYMLNNTSIVSTSMFLSLIDTKHVFQQGESACLNTATLETQDALLPKSVKQYHALDNGCKNNRKPLRQCMTQNNNIVDFVCSNRFAPLADTCISETTEVTGDSEHQDQSINISTIIREKNNRKKKVMIVADSYGRYCAPLLQDELGDQFEVSSVFKPNATFNDVTKNLDKMTKSIASGGYVVVLAGSNDIRSVNSVLPSLNSLNNELIERVTQNNKNIIIPSIPYRFDKPKLNKVIKQINTARSEKLSKIAVNNKNVVFINEQCGFNRKDHTRHGLHHNRQGKIKLCKLLARTIVGHNIDSISNTKSSPSYTKHSKISDIDSNNIGSTGSLLENSTVTCESYVGENQFKGFSEQSLSDAEHFRQLFISKYSHTENENSYTLDAGQSFTHENYVVQPSYKSTSDHNISYQLSMSNTSYPEVYSFDDDHSTYSEQDVECQSSFLDKNNKSSLFY